MLAVNDHRDSSQPRSQDPVERRPVPRMHDVGTEAPQEPDEPRKGAHIVSRRFVELENGHVGVDAGPVSPPDRHTDNGVTLTRPGGVDKVHDAILEAADDQVVNHVHHQRRHGYRSIQVWCHSSKHMRDQIATERS